MILKHRYLTQQNRQVSPSDSVSHSNLHLTSVLCLVSSLLSLCVAITFLHRVDLAEFIYKAHGLLVSSFCVALCPAIVSISCSKGLSLSIFHMQILYCHLACTSFTKSFPIAHTTGAQFPYQQRCPWHFPSISSIIVDPWFQRTTVFYSALGSNSVAFVDFTLSPHPSNSS